MARAPIRKSRTTPRALSLIFALSLATSLALTGTPASAHQPVILDSLAKSATTSPILLDGTISFAVYANFTKSEKRDSLTQFVRFQQKKGERLALQYLIPDTRMMRKLSRNALPEVTLIAPSGKRERIAITERTPFFEPYGGKRYIYLARVDRSAESGLYTVEIKAKKAGFTVTTVIAIGTQEIPGEVLTFGSSAATCPTPIEESEPIEASLANQLVGMKEEVAKLCADLNEWGYRVGERDGEFFALTRDYRIDRITVSITKGIITEVQVG